MWLVTHNNGTHTLHLDRAFRQFWEKLASIIAVKGGYIELKTEFKYSTWPNFTAVIAANCLIALSMCSMCPVCTTV